MLSNRRLADLTAYATAKFVADKAWARFLADPKKWQQTVEDKDGEPHYCLCYRSSKTVKVHGVLDSTDNYCEVTVQY
jgi:hypothetical protein